jgi:ATP-binding cassette subfamily C (CFTR/MRP) protein 1
MPRGSLIATVLKKATDLNRETLDPAESVMFMSTDVERINKGLRDMYKLWADMFQVAVEM